MAHSHIASNELWRQAASMNESRGRRQLSQAPVGHFLGKTDPDVQKYPGAVMVLVQGQLPLGAEKL